MRPRTILLFAVLSILLSPPATSLAQKPELVVQTGHANSIDSVAFSPDGKLLVSGGDNGLIVLWDIESGRQIRTLTNKGNNNLVTLSSNNKLLSSAREVKIWDISTGEEVKFKDASAPATLSLDGKLLAFTTGFMNDKVSLLDLSSGQVIRTVTDKTFSANLLAFSPDGKIIAGASRKSGNPSDGKIRLWDVSTGKVLRTLEGHELGATSIVFSTDSKTLISTSDTDAVKLWDVGSGKLRRAINVSGKSLAVSPDGQTLAIGGNYEETTKLYDISTGQLVREIPGTWSKVAFSPDGHVLANSMGDTIYLWDVATGHQLGELKKHSQTASAVALSLNGEMLATGSVDGGVTIWDISSGKEPRTLPGPSKQRLWCVAFSPDNRLLASGGSSREQPGMIDEQHGIIDVWEIATGKKLYSLKGDSLTEVTTLAFSPDSKTLISWQGSFLVEESRRGIKVWDALTGKELRAASSGFSSAKSVVFSSNCNALASLNFNSSEKKAHLEVWDSGAATRLRAFDEEMPAGTEFSYHIALSSDGKTLARVFDVVISDEVLLKIKLWNIATGESQEIISKSSYGARTISLNSDGSLVTVSLRMSRGEEIKLWDVKTQKEITTFRGSSGWLLESILFSNNSKFLVAGAQDNTLRLLDAASGDELARLIGVDEKDWLVVSPGGLFDGSSQGWQKGVWRFSQKSSDFAPVETYFREFFYPNLLGEVVAGKRPKASVKIEELDRRQPQIKIALAEPPASSGVISRTVKVNLKITDAPAGARDLRLFRNGSLVKMWAGELSLNKDLTVAIPIVAGENRLTAYAFNRSNIKSNDVALVVTGDAGLKRAGTLYLLAIGVGQYSNPQYNLNYTVADAEGFGEEVKRQQEQLGRYQRVELLSLLNQDATKAKVLAALTKLADTIQPEDGVIVYFSGHGTAQRDRFYLIPHDLGYQGPRSPLSPSGLETILAHSISDAELEEAFRGIDAGQILLVIDACNSGQALEAEEKRRGPMNAKGLAQLAYEKGMYIVTASQTVELAFESDALKHSYLTYALVEEGLKTGVADKEPTDGQVFLREWFDYATERVPRMRQEKVEQKAKQQGKSLELIEVDEQGKVQTPRVFYRREPDAQPLVVAKPGAMK